MAHAPRTVERSYLLHEKLGEGGMGAVYRATRRIDNSVVALKLVGRKGATRLDPDANLGLRLLLAREFQTLSSLHHPHVIQVLDYGFDERLGPYFTMELLEAPRTLFGAGLGRPPAEKVRLLAELLRALAYLHRRGIIHRDIKPSNVLVAGGVVKVVDFGLATAAPEGASLGGTLAYMAPELLEGGRPSVASDLYAVGVLAREMFSRAGWVDDSASAAEATTMTLLDDAVRLRPTEVGTTRPLGPAAGGAPPPEAGPSATERAPARPAPGPGPPRPLGPDDVDVEGPLGDVVRRLLSADPSRRHASAVELLYDLGRALGEPLPVETAETRESFLQASEFVGREAELAALDRALREVLAGRPGGGALIGGESGVGKSRLTAELRTLALVKGAWVAEGQAVATGRSSYQVWLPVLRALCLRAELADADASALHDLVPDLPALLGREVPAAPPLPPAAAQSRLLQAIEALFRAQARPTVVLLEDLQWAGADSLMLLGRLCRLTAELPLLLVGNYRDDEAPGLPESAPGLAAIKLGRLGREQVGRLSASMLGAAGEAPALVEYLCRETEGNVFFLVEVVRALAEQAGRLDRIRPADLPERLLTGGIERIAQRRVDRVREGPDRALLDLAATLGRQLDLAVLERAAPGVDLRGFLLTCANAAVLESRAGDWRFSHDKLREAILARLAPGERARHHGAIARAMEAVYAGEGLDRKSAALAHHFEQAGDADRAWAYHVRAGDVATRLCSYGEARHHYAAALAALAALPADDEGRRRKVDTLLKLVYTRLVADTAEQNFARMAEARAQLDALAAGGELGQNDRLRLARVNHAVGRIHFYRGEAREALSYYRQVLPVALESGDEELMALPGCLIGTALLSQGDMRRAEPLLARSIGPLERLGEPFEWFRAVGYHGSALIALGRYREGVAELERVLARADQIGQPSLASAANLMSGCSYLFSGDWPLTVAHHRRVLELASRTGDTLHLSLAHSSIAWAESHLGRHDEALAHRARAEAIARGMGGRLMLADWYEAGDAEIALNAGRLDEALARAEAVAEAGRAAGLLFSRGVAERVRGAALARAGRGGEADAHFEASLEALEQGGSLLQAARTRAEWALALRARGERARAEARTAEARAALGAAGCDYALAELGRRWSGG
ncbi:MAG TPA: AAA family ATPase [Polyangiaceae bacterium]|nr:AAA family ATPase [Polyangiaceae bacterium]